MLKIKASKSMQSGAQWRQVIKAKPRLVFSHPKRLGSLRDFRIYCFDSSFRPAGICSYGITPTGTSYTEWRTTRSTGESYTTKQRSGTSEKESMATGEE